MTNKPWSILSKIKAVLDREDIEGLLAIGCPADEYDGEATLIESRVAQATNFGETKLDLRQVQSIVAEVWNDRFGPFSQGELEKRQPAFAVAARDIASAIGTP